MLNGDVVRRLFEPLDLCLLISDSYPLFGTKDRPPRRQKPMSRFEYLILFEVDLIVEREIRKAIRKLGIVEKVRMASTMGIQHGPQVPNINLWVHGTVCSICKPSC